MRPNSSARFEEGLRCGKELVWSNFEGLRHPKQGFEGRVSHPAFNPADVGAVQLGAKRELLLGEAESFPTLADRVAEGDKELGDRVVVWHAHTLFSC